MRLSGVKVPRPASPYITHETILTDGNGGCCISWQSKEYEGVYFALVVYGLIWLSWPWFIYGLDKIWEILVCFWC